MRVLGYNLLRMLMQFDLLDEEGERSMDWFIKRLIIVGAKVAYLSLRQNVLVASAFPLARHDRHVLG